MMTLALKRGNASFDLLADEAKMLSEIGFIAAYHGDVASADAVFDGLAGMRPGRAYPWIGKALGCFAIGRSDDAVLFLEHQKGFMTDPDELDLMQVWHGMALQLSGHQSQAHTLLNKVANGSGPGRDMAKSLLGLNEEGK